MEDASEKNNNSNPRSYLFCFLLSIVFFVLSLITFWQGVLKLKAINIGTQSLRTIGKSILTLQNSGAVLLLVGFFSVLFAILFAIYASLLKKK